MRIYLWFIYWLGTELVTTFIWINSLAMVYIYIYIYIYIYGTLGRWGNFITRFRLCNTPHCNMANLWLESHMFIPHTSLPCRYLHHSMQYWQFYVVTFRHLTTNPRFIRVWLNLALALHYQATLNHTQAATMGSKTVTSDRKSLASGCLLQPGTGVF